MVEGVVGFFQRNHFEVTYPSMSHVPAKIINTYDSGLFTMEECPKVPVLKYRFLRDRREFLRY